MDANGEAARVPETRPPEGVGHQRSRSAPDGLELAAETAGAARGRGPKKTNIRGEGRGEGGSDAEVACSKRRQAPCTVIPCGGGVSRWGGTQQGVRRTAQTFRQRGGVGGLGRLRVGDRLADAYGDAPPPLVQELAEQIRGRAGLSLRLTPAEWDVGRPALPYQAFVERPLTPCALCGVGTLFPGRRG